MDIKSGNIFTTECQTIVNTINCVGVMGAGIAFECRLRYPDMFMKYQQLCRDKMINIGSLWIYKTETRWILNFPTKYHWKYESKPEYLKKGLQKFVDSYKEKGITSIAFPLLGASNGGIRADVSIGIMQEYLSNCDIPIEIYHYDPLAYDDLFVRFKQLWNSIPEKTLAKEANIRIDFVKKVKEALIQEDIRSLSRLLTVKGIGETTLEKSFHFIQTYKD